MKKLLLLLPLIGVLTACQSKREICAEMRGDWPIAKGAEKVALARATLKNLGMRDPNKRPVARAHEYCKSLGG